MTTPTCFIGCDVGKKEIAVFHSDGGASFILPNQPEALACFVRTLNPGCLILWEATGGYEAALLDALRHAGHACHRAYARKSLPPRRRGEGPHSLARNLGENRRHRCPHARPLWAGTP